MSTNPTNPHYGKHEPMELAPGLTVCAECSAWGRWVRWRDCKVGAAHVRLIHAILDQGASL